MNVEEECDMCFEYQRCSAEKCTTHKLYDGSILDFARAMRDGRLWGDIIYLEEKEKLAKETNEDKEKRLKKQASEERKSMDNLKVTVLNKNRLKNCVKVGSKYVLKHKYNNPCENLKLDDTVLSDGSVYPGGCWAHIENMCPYVHPDEKDKYDFKGKSRLLLQKGGKKSRTHKNKH
jgi:hypothetical protein